MNYSSLQWRAIFVLDILVKFSVAYGGAILASLGLVVVAGIEYIVEFAILAVALAVLNAMFLMLGQRLAAQLNGRSFVSYPMLRSGLILVSANAMFVAAVTILFSFGGGFSVAIALTAFLAITNLIPIFLVHGVSWMLRRGLRSS